MCKVKISDDVCNHLLNLCGHEVKMLDDRKHPGGGRPEYGYLHWE